MTKIMSEIIQLHILTYYSNLVKTVVILPLKLTKDKETLMHQNYLHERHFIHV